ncbi:hypothetical protein WIS52_02765 [Pseudonocardia nematodicida]|uniref:Uncharacterized protein n=1 Tax=Pseudonocardia nematodicida TaxID=1206997 RepID=A0ABV1K4L2_9PSEU
MTDDMRSTIIRAVTGVGRVLREAGKAQEELWARLERVDPQPGEDLHWEPSIRGWRLVGEFLPSLGREPCD